MKKDNEKFCQECGEIINIKAEICPKCGVRQALLPQEQSDAQLNHGEHKCLNCNYQGPMKTWMRNNSLPQFIAILLLLFCVIPGVIFIAYFWNKNKCPRCGAVGKTVNR